MNKPTPAQELARDKILEKAKENLVAKDEKYLESLADMDVKLVAEKTRSAVIEQGKLIATHQRALEENQILLKQAKTRAEQLSSDIQGLQKELKETKDKLDSNNKIVKGIVDIIEEELCSGFWYKIKTFFGKFKRGV